jgi:hypothetical protein
LTSSSIPLIPKQSSTVGHDNTNFEAARDAIELANVSSQLRVYIGLKWTLAITTEEKAGQKSKVSDGKGKETVLSRDFNSEGLEGQNSPQPAVFLRLMIGGHSKACQQTNQGADHAVISRYCSMVSDMFRQSLSRIDDIK